MPNYPGAIERKLGDKLGERISVRDFGAVGDGETDDTAAIQAAIDCAQDNSGMKIGAVFIPAGHYRVSETLVISEALVFGGETSHSARFIYTGSDAAIRVERKRPVSPGASTWIYRVYLHDFLVISTQGWDVAGTGIHLHELSEFELRNVGVGQGPDNGFGVGIACSVDIGVFHGVLLGGNHVSISLDHFDPDGSLPSGICTSIEICGMSNLFVTDTAIRVRGLADAHIHDCWFELFHSAILIDNDETGEQAASHCQYVEQWSSHVDPGVQVRGRCPRRQDRERQRCAIHVHVCLRYAQPT